MADAMEAARRELMIEEAEARAVRSTQMQLRASQEFAREQGMLDSNTWGQSPQPQVRESQTLWDGLVAGWQSSTGGLMARGQAPEVIIGENSTRAQRIASMVSMTLGDAPTLLAGGVGGAVAGSAVKPGLGTIVGAGAGSFGFTEAARTWFLEGYRDGYDKSMLADRLVATAWSGTKGTIIGGATAGAGQAASRVVTATVPGTGLGGALGSRAVPMVESRVGQFGAITAAELATMVSVASALEGELPDPDMFLDAAILLGGLKGATVTSSKLVELYRRTGMKPDEVAQRAMRDPDLAAQLLDNDYTMPPALRYLEDSPFALDGRVAAAVNLGEAGVRTIRDLEPFAANLLEPGSAAAPPTLVGRPPRIHEIVNLDATPGAARTGGELINQLAETTRRERGGRQPTEQQISGAMELLQEAVTSRQLKQIINPDTPDANFRLIALAKLYRETRDSLSRTIDELRLRDGGLTQADYARFAVEAEHARTVFRAMDNLKADVGRTMNVIKQLSREMTLDGIDSATIKRALDAAGGESTARAMFDLMRDLTPAQRSKASFKPTRFEMFVEAWKSMLLSSIQTMQVNGLGNLLMAATRVPEAYWAATLSKLTLRDAAKATTFADATALTVGLAIGAANSIRGASNAFRSNILESATFAQAIKKTYNEIGTSRKVELERQGKIPGQIGEIIRAPFKGLQVADSLSRSMNSSATLYEMASRAARRKGYSIGSRAYMQEVQRLVNDPTAAMVKRAEADATRFVFQQDGRITKALENLRSDLPALQFVVPFIKAPGGIFREFTRRSPLAPLIKQWRDDVKAGGARADKAYAEVTGGLAVGITAFMLARDGAITGGGHPDPTVRRAQLNAGFQPYSIKTSDGNYVSIRRWEPVATMLGLAADLAQAWEVLESGEQDRAAAALMWAGTEVVRNKTWLRGVSDTLNALSDPTRYANPFIEGLAGTVVPGAMAQAARSMDPYVREVDSIMGALKARTPWLRETLPVRRDGYGEPIAAMENLWPGSPSSVRPMSRDPVRQEALRLGVAPASTPRQLSAGSVIGESARIELTADQRDMFASESGQLSHEILSRMIQQPGYQNMPAIQQRAMFNRVFATARRNAAMQVLPPDQRAAAIFQLMQEEGLY